MKFEKCIVVFALTVCLNAVMGSPVAKSTIVKIEDLPVTNVVAQKEISQAHTVPHPSEVLIPGRVWCSHEGEEPSEDDACQGHCMLKGYSYGLCIKNTCSCI